MINRTGCRPCAGSLSAHGPSRTSFKAGSEGLANFINYSIGERGRHGWWYESSGQEHYPTERCYAYHFPPPRLLHPKPRRRVRTPTGYRVLDNPYRRNADGGDRRRERARIGDDSQESIDRSVIDKVRAGRTGSITLYELERASPGLIPRPVNKKVFQDAFDHLWDDDHSAALEWEGADLTLYQNDDNEFPQLVVFLETADIDPRFVFPGNQHVPRLRFYANDSSVDTAVHGGWENMW